LISSVEKKFKDNLHYDIKNVNNFVENQRRRSIRVDNAIADNAKRLLKTEVKASVKKTIAKKLSKYNDELIDKQRESKLDPWDLFSEEFTPTSGKLRGACLDTVSEEDAYSKDELESDDYEEIIRDRSLMLTNPVYTGDLLLGLLYPHGDWEHSVVIFFAWLETLATRFLVSKDGGEFYLPDVHLFGLYPPPNFHVDIEARLQIGWDHVRRFLNYFMSHIYEYFDYVRHRYTEHNRREILRSLTHFYSMISGQDFIRSHNYLFRKANGTELLVPSFDPDLSSVIRNLPDFLAFMTAIYTNKTLKGRLSTMWLYIKVLFPKLITTFSYECMTAASSYLLNKLLDKEELLDYALSLIPVKYVATSGSVLESPLLRDSIRLLSEICATGLMSAMGLWSESFNKWFTNFAFVTAQGSGILVSVINVIKQLVEGGQLFWKSGNFMDFFMEKSLRELHDSFDKIRHRTSVVLSETYNAESNAVLVADIKALKTAIHVAQLNRGIIDKSYNPLNQLEARLNEYEAKIIQRNAIGTIRTAPIVLLIVGEPGTGKSSLVFTLTKIALNVSGIQDVILENISTINETATRDDTIHRNTKAVILDDVNAIRNNFNPTPSTTRLIKLVNLMPCFADKASLEDKGTVPYNFNVVTLTSNSRDLGIPSVMNFADATSRRIDITVEVVVPKMYRAGQSRKIDKATLPPTGNINELMLYRVTYPKYDTQGTMKDTVVTKIGMNDVIFVEEEGLQDLVDYTTMLNIFADRATSSWNASLRYKNQVDNIMTGDLCPHHLPLLSTGQSSCRICHPMIVNVSPYIHTEPAEHYESLSESTTSTSAENSVFQATSGVMAVTVSLTLLPVLCLLSSKTYISDSMKYFFRRFVRKASTINQGLKILDLLVDTSDNLVAKEDQAFAFFMQRREILRGIAAALAVLASAKAASMLFSGLQSIFNQDIPIVVNNDDNKDTEVKQVLLEPTAFIKTHDAAVEVELPPPDTIAPYVYPRIGGGMSYTSPPISLGLLKPESNTTYDKLSTVLYKNMYKMLIGDKQCNGFFVGSHFFVTVKHVFPSDFITKPACMIELRLRDRITTTNVIQLENTQVWFVDNMDIAFIYLPTINPKANIIQYVRPLVGETLSIPEASIQYLDFENDTVVSKTKKLTNGSYYGVCSLRTDDNITSGVALIFDGVSHLGMSGAPVILTDGHQSSIIGIQSAKSDDGTSLVQIFPPITLSLLSSKIKSYVRGCEILFRDIPNMTTELTSYSIIPHLQNSAIEYVGTVAYHGASHRSSYRRTVFNQYLMKNNRFIYNEEYLSSDEWIIPRLAPSIVIDDQGNKCWINHVLVGIAQASTIDVVEPFESMVRLIYEDYISPIEVFDFGTIPGPARLSQVINGAEGITALNKNAAAGGNYPGTVKDWLVMKNNEWIFKEPMASDYKRMEQDYLRGVVDPQIAKPNVKDEVVKSSKAISLRVFMSFSVVYTTLCKVYLQPILNLIILNPDLFEVVIGINPLGKSWGVIETALRQRKYLMDGDFKKFDKKQMRMFLLMFKRMIYTLCIKVKYPEYATVIALNLIDAMIYYYINCSGDIIQLLRSLASGCLLTIFLNCFLNSCYYRLAWFSNFTTPFRHSNTLRVLGDDSVNGTNEAAFTMSYMSEQLEQYGVTFTPASKTAHSKDFVTFDEVMFLKRGFKRVKLSDGEYYTLCPLSEISLFKELSFTDCAISMENAVMCTNLIDVHKQYWFHGEDKFNEMTKFLQNLAMLGNLSRGIGPVGSTSALRWYTYAELEKQYLNGTIQVQFI